MGYIHTSARIRNLSGTGGEFEGKFLVDTGAMHCMAPSDHLNRLGIKPEQNVEYELANGEPVHYDVGFARIAFEGSETIAPVIFGPPGVEPILGVIALESAGFSIDPVAQRLRKLPRFKLKCIVRD
jgi:clan AA aspartic protease